MDLTRTQQQRIAKYLRDVDLQLSALPDKAREAALEQLRARIQQELQQFTRTAPDDRQVEQILANCGTPSRIASDLLGKYGGRDAFVLSNTDRRWLGVCGGIAERFVLDVRVVRLAAVALGLLTGPLSLVIYLAAYFHLYLSCDEDERTPKIERGPLVRAVVSSLAVLFAFFLGVAVLIWGIALGFARFSDHTLASLGSWGWIADHHFGLFVWALVMVLPLAAFSRLPMANGWDATARKLVQAGIAVYAMTLALGLASLLVGIILRLVKDLTV